ncbi:sulfatase-like hydrolase/transferase [Pontiellaceae bacterium B1224]|nr:sulfatase-like hydrolase/transferase [Pontiellaceae bacterium B1224]
MRKTGQLILLGIISSFTFLISSFGASPRPNVVFIFADDMSYETIGAAGMLDIDTPNLDRLVENGASFTHAYNMGAWGGAVCAASRSMLNSGRFVWQAQSGVKSGVKSKSMWSQRMQDAGYQTYMTGKWHVPGVEPETLFNIAKNVRGGMPKDFRNKGSADGTKPKGYGYDRPKDEEDYLNGWKPWDTTNGGFWEGGTHWSEVVANDSVEFLDAAAKEDKPFFMYLAFNASHDPRQSPKEYIDRYPLDRIELPENFLPQYPYADKVCGLGLRDEKLMPYPRTEFAVKVHRQEYFALITHMDDQIGRIFQALEKTGKADNTYIVFTADHGLACGHHGFSGKQNMYDHSVRVPFLVVGPDVKPGVKIDAPIYLQDVMATSLELAGASVDGVDFKSLLPLLRGEADEHYPEIYGAYMNKQRMITKGDWKFIYYPTANVERLFNLTKDPNEMNDLAGNPEYAAQLSRMRGELTALSKELDDPLMKKSAKKKK